MLIALQVLMVVSPMAAIVIALVLVERWQRGRQDAIVRQIALTDAIHRRFGAIVAPTVERRLWGRWQVVIPVPLEHAEIVPVLLALAQQAVPARVQTSPRAFRIIFTPPTEAPAATRARRAMAA
jgi:hypothetical protein